MNESVAWLASGDEIIKNLVHDRLVERSGIPEGGIYSTRILAKSGWLVTGHIEVNSPHSKVIQ